MHGQVPYSTSAITSLPTILNVIVPRISLGTFTFLFNMLFFLGQFLVEPGTFRPSKLLQIVLTFFFGLAVDVNMWLLGWWAPPNYAFQLATLLCWRVHLRPEPGQDDLGQCDPHAHRLLHVGRCAAGSIWSLATSRPGWTYPW